MQERYANKDIVVVGAGKSGRALCRFFASRSAHIILSDQRSRERIEMLETLDGLPITYDLGGHNLEYFRNADLVVLSPGVPGTISPVQAAKKNNIPVIGEIEVAIRELDVPMIGITGTNGKSTVTALAGEAFKAAGFKTYVGGNIGEPLTAAVGGVWDWIVVELSSFQLETMESFRPRYSMLLNISADHLDRYPDMAAYIAAKKNIFMNQTSSDFMILNADDDAVMQMAKDCSARPIRFSCRKELPEGMSLSGNEIVWRWQGKDERFATSGLKIKGLHNIANVMAAMIPPLVEGCDTEMVWKAMGEFTGLKHRMNLVRTLNGVDWYNDSKGTNIGSVIMSLAGIDAPVTLIAGGKDKGGDFGELATSIQEKVDHLILMGEAAGRMEKEIGPVADIVRVDSLEQAVLKAHELTAPGSVVLLSPGCSSFDMFENFGKRGELFCRLVEQLEPEKAVSNGNSSGI